MRILSTIYFILLCLILACNSAPPTRPVYKSNSDTTKPIAAYFLTTHNIQTTDYKQNNDQYSCEGHTSVYGNNIHYKVYGNEKSEWTQIELTIHITIPATRYPSKYRFAKMLETLYIRTINRDTTTNDFKNMIFNIAGETLEFIYTPLNEPHIQTFYGKLTKERIRNKKFRFVRHILSTKYYHLPNHTITIERYPATLPYQWEDPYYIQVTITHK